MKLYIAVLDDVPDYMVPTLVAHTILNADSAFAHIPEYREWRTNSFKKVTVRVNQKEFNRIRQLDNVYLGYESSVLEGNFSCAIVCPSAKPANVLMFAKLWSPKISNS